MTLPLDRELVAPGLDDGDFVAWRNPRGKEGTLALLTSDRLIFADPGAPADIEAAIDRFREDGLAPNGAREIAPGSISKIRFDKRSTDIAILYTEDDRERGICYYDFGNPTARDSFVEAFKIEFGNRFADRVREHTPLTAALRPLLLGSLVAALTWALHFTAHEIASGQMVSFGGGWTGAQALIAGVAEFVGPAGILLLGGCGLAISLATLIRRVAHPPLLRTLTQRA